MKKYTTESYSYYLSENDFGTVRIRLQPLINWFKIENYYYLIFDKRMFEEGDYISSNGIDPEFFIQELPVQLEDFWIYKTKYLIKGTSKNPKLKKSSEFNRIVLRNNN
tara:strand:+ start:277 stop:600 length:324 start_codon:yes stop_codon:yes gene_type:complete